MLGVETTNGRDEKNQKIFRRENFMELVNLYK
jgi:hypothetical protein